MDTLLTEIMIFRGNCEKIPAYRRRDRSCKYYFTMLLVCCGRAWVPHSPQLFGVNGRISARVGVRDLVLTGYSWTIAAGTLPPNRTSQLKSFSDFIPHEKSC